MLVHIKCFHINVLRQDLHVLWLKNSVMLNNEGFKFSQKCPEN